MRKTFIVLLILVFFLRLGLPISLTAEEKFLPKTKSSPVSSYAPKEVLVKFKPGVSQTKENLTKRTAGVASIEEEIQLSEGSDEEIQLVKLKEGVSVKEAVKKLESQKSVEFAEPNNRVSLTVTPDDTYYSSYQWAHPKIASPSAWNVETGSSSVIIAVIDTGVDYNHPDLAGKVINGPDFFNDDSDSWDDHGHGTHVAGIAAAITNNARGVAGVSWGSQVLALKVLGASGWGYFSDIAQAIIYAADYGAKVINLSLGGSGYSQTLQDAITYAHNRGVTVVAAAGNSGSSSISYPAGNSYVVGVGATDSSDNRAWFSTYNSTVDVAAPGVSILSTYPGNRYVYMSGTSMATPYVAGLTALVLSKNPSWSPDQVESRMESTANDLGSSGRDNYYGYGRINAYQAVTNTVDNTPPTNPTVTSSHTTGAWSNDNTISAFWLAGTDDSSGIDGYSVEWSTGATATPDAIKDLEETQNSTTSPSLSDGNWYFHLRTVDNADNWASAVHLGPFYIDTTRPTSPVGLGASGVSTSQINLSWTGSSDPGSGLAGYKIERSPNDSSDWTEIAITAATSYSDPSLSPSTTYWYRIRAYDKAGNYSYYSNLAGATTLTPSPSPSPSPSPPPRPSFGGIERIWGMTSDGTAVAISQAGWPTSKVVLVARNDYFADGLAGVPLAYAFKNVSGVNTPAPLLLTGPQGLSSETKEEIQRLKAETVIILGGPGAVLPQVESELSQTSGVRTVQRIWGETAAGTAQDIFERIRIIAAESGIPKPNTAIITTQGNFQDALAVSSPAAANNMPILLSDISSLPSETLEALSQGEIGETIIVGGEAVVSGNIEAELNTRGYDVLARLQGATEYETAVNIATTGNSLFRFTKPGSISIARGDFFADALAGGALASRMNPSPILLAHPGGLSPALSSYLTSNKSDITKVHIFGGPEVLSNNLQIEIERLVK